MTWKDWHQKEDQPIVTLKDGTPFVPGMTAYWPYSSIGDDQRIRFHVDTYTDCWPEDALRCKDKRGIKLHYSWLYGSAAAAAQFVVRSLERELEDTTVHLQQQLDKWGTALYDLRARES